MVLVAVLEDLRHFLGGARQHDGERHLPVGGERIGLERAPAFLLGDDAGDTDQRLEVLDDGAAPVEHGRSGSGILDSVMKFSGSAVPAGGSRF